MSHASSQNENLSFYCVIFQHLELRKVRASACKICSFISALAVNVRVRLEILPFYALHERASRGDTFFILWNCCHDDKHLLARKCVGGGLFGVKNWETNLGNVKFIWDIFRFKMKNFVTFSCSPFIDISKGWTSSQFH